MLLHVEEPCIDAVDTKSEYYGIALPSCLFVQKRSEVFFTGQDVIRIRQRGIR